MPQARGGMQRYCRHGAETSTVAAGSAERQVAPREEQVRCGHGARTVEVVERHGQGQPHLAPAQRRQEARRERLTPNTVALWLPCFSGEGRGGLRRSVAGY